MKKIMLLGIVFCICLVFVSASTFNANTKLKTRFLDSDGDGVWDFYDNCDFVYNSWQGDIDNDGIGDACDYEDTEIEFAAHYEDTEGNNFDDVTGGGTCNGAGCAMAFLYDNEVAYCPGPNYCSFYGDCYPGDGTAMEMVNRPSEYLITSNAWAICIGDTWWDCDSGGGDGTNTPLPGMEICEMCGGVWTTTAMPVGEYEWNYNGYSCCGDDVGAFGGEYYYPDAGMCLEVS